MPVIKMSPIQIIVRKQHQIAIILIHFILLRVKALNPELHPIRYHPVTQGRFKSPLYSLHYFSSGILIRQQFIYILSPLFYANICKNPFFHTHHDSAHAEYFHPPKGCIHIDQIYNRWVA